MPDPASENRCQMWGVPLRCIPLTLKHWVPPGRKGCSQSTSIAHSLGFSWAQGKGRKWNSLQRVRNLRIQESNRELSSQASFGLYLSCHIHSPCHSQNEALPWHSSSCPSFLYFLCTCCCLRSTDLPSLCPTPFQFVVDKWLGDFDRLSHFMLYFPCHLAHYVRVTCLITHLSH